MNGLEKKNRILFYLVNSLTITRIILSPFVFYFIFVHQRATAFIIFLIGVATDLLDGDLARRFNLTSKLGDFLDGLADLLLSYAAAIPLFVLKEFSLPLEIAFLIATLLIISSIIKHSLKNKKFCLPGRRPSTTINSYFVYTTLALFIINSPYKNSIGYITCLIMAFTALDYFRTPKEK
ncbi:MAG: CDP-alcohol phosphatidyltransferase family protein [Patescibacteria group bacterium]|nr:CDP-alcohol phosphatidyltransferase family protein [Patescibacteria group bacterium]